MKYQELPLVTKAVAQAKFGTGDENEISSTLTSLALYESDRKWVELQLIKFSQHHSQLVRGTVATCIGHLARIHRSIDEERLFPILGELLKDPSVRGRADDAADDISTFLHLDKQKLINRLT